MAVPATTVDNASIAAHLGVTEEWIQGRTGTSTRHILGSGERVSDIAAEAGRRALGRAGLDPSELDLVLVGTTTQDELTPNTAPIVSAEIGATRAGAFDVGAACTAFLAAMAVGASQIESARAQNVLVIGADALFQFLDPDDKRTAAVFGDGAGAAVMTATDPPGRVGPVALRADGTQHELIYATRDEATIHMKGHETFKHAVARMSEVTHEALALADTDLDEIDLFIYHQANSRIIAAVGEQLALPSERVLDYIDEFANTSAASIPLALARAEEDGRLQDGYRLLLAAFGAGFTWGGAVVEWGLNGS